MTRTEIEEKLEKEKKGNLVIEIIYNNKNYIQAIKPIKKGFEYIYYEINDNELKPIIDNDLLEIFKEKYENRLSNIIY